MNKPRGRLIGMGVLAGTLIFFMALPALLARGRDHALTGTIHTEQVEPIVVGNNRSYTLPERLGLLSTDYPGGQSMELHTGTRFDSRGAQVQAAAEIDALVACGLLPQGAADCGACQVSGVWFVADSEAPACSLMVWELHAYAETSFLSLQMDDETGKIIGFHLYLEETDGDLPQWPALAEAAQRWAEYLQLEAVISSESSSWKTGGIDVAPPDLDAGNLLRVEVKDDNASVGYVLYANENELSIYLS